MLKELPCEIKIIKTQTISSERKSIYGMKSDDKKCTPERNKQYNKAFPKNCTISASDEIPGVQLNGNFSLSPKKIGQCSGHADNSVTENISKKQSDSNNSTIVINIVPNAKQAPFVKSNQNCNSQNIDQDQNRMTKQYMSKFQESMNLSIVQCTICKEAWPKNVAKNKQGIEGHVCHRCKLDKNPKKTSAKKMK